MKVVNKTTLTDGAQTLRFWMGETISGMHRRPLPHITTPNQFFFLSGIVTYCYIMLNLCSLSNIHNFHQISPRFEGWPLRSGQQQVLGSSQVGGQRGCDAAVCALQRQRDRRPTRVMSSEMVPFYVPWNSLSYHELPHLWSSPSSPSSPLILRILGEYPILTNPPMWRLLINFVMVM